MAGKKKPGIPVKSINIKLRMIHDLIDVTGSAKDSWNPAEISDDMKAIAYIHDLADTWNPAQLNEALKYLGFATIDSWNPAIIEETKNKLVKYFLPTDASGNPIELDLMGALPYKATSLTIDLLPIQDLHGQSAPYPAGVGKNKCPAISNPIPSSGTVLVDYGKDITLSSCTISFKFSGKFSNIGGSFLNLQYNNGTNQYITMGFMRTMSNQPPVANTEYSNELLTYIVENGFTFRKIIFYNYASFTNAIFDEMQIEDSNVRTTFAPYENICPISGRDSVTLTVNGDDTEITFKDTVYGGNVNILEGGTSSTYGYIASYDGEELPGAWISDRDAYAAGTSPTIGAEVAYVLTTPTELTTPANKIALVNGENILSTDGDNINITYKAILNS